jgi:hypothetical protein
MILGNQRRKLTVEYLSNSNGKAEIREIVDFISEREGIFSQKHKKSVYVSLVQTHIPKMRRAGIISLNGSVVELISVPEDVTVFMEVIGKNDISWSLFNAFSSIFFIFTAIYLKNIPMLLLSIFYLITSLLQRWKVIKVAR